MKLAQFTQDRKSIPIGQIEVEDQKVEPALQDAKQPFVPVAQRRHGIPFALQIETRRVGEVGVVFDQGDARMRARRIGFRPTHRCV